MIQVAPFEVNDFSGGITDQIFDPNHAKYEILDNLPLEENKTPQTRPGSVVDVTTNADSRIPAGNQRIGDLINYDNNSALLVRSAKKIYYRNPVAYATLLGPSGNDVFTTGSTASISSYTQWNGHVFLTHDQFPEPMKIYKDGSGTLQVRSSGLPGLASLPTVTAGAVGTRSYLYAFHYFYAYTVNKQDFQDFGPVSFVELINSGDPAVNPNAISLIPVLSNGSTRNFDTANVKVRIYRTTNGGTDNWLLGEVTNGTTTFNDNFSDASLTDNELLYLSDGSLDNDPPPLSKFVHVVNNTGYYGYIKKGAQEFPYKIRQSVPFDPDSCPEAFEDSVEDTLRGISSCQSIPIILCNKYIYRIEGAFDQFGRGSMNHVRISDTAGCVSNLSCVQAEGQLFWAGNDGFYHTDGYRVMKISDGINPRYAAMIAASNDTRKITGRFDEKNRRVIWTCQVDSSSFDNDMCFLLELRQPITPTSVFSTISGGASFRPSAIEFFNKKFYRADTRGYVFLHDEQFTTDPLVDTLNFVSTWATTPIIHTYRSVAFNFGSTFMRKIATKMLLTCRNKTNVSIQITAINDDGKIKRALKEIRWRRNFVWSDPEFVWGDADCYWNAEGLIEQWRRMPAKGLRFSYLQIEITNAYTTITNSDTIGNATFNPTLNTATLDTAAASDWPIDCVGYFISSSADNYQRQFQIIARTNDTLTLLDPGNQVPLGSLKWLIKGTRKAEVLNMLSYNLHWANLSKTQSTFEAGQDGGNS